MAYDSLVKINFKILYEEPKVNQKKIYDPLCNATFSVERQNKLPEGTQLHQINEEAITSNTSFLRPDDAGTIKLFRFFFPQ